MAILKILIHKKIFWFIAILVLGVIAYSNSFQGTFVFDDFPLIVENLEIRQNSPLEDLFRNSRRPFVYLTLAFNYRLNHLNPLGYHLFNLLIHLGTGLIFFRLLHRILLTKNLKTKYQSDAVWLSGIISLIWLVHPIQTQSVTYIIQRSESLMGLFYALTLYGAMRSYEKGKEGRWTLGAILFCLLGTITKEVMVTAPLMVILFDRIFLFNSIKNAFHKRKLLYLGLSLSWLLMMYLLLLTSTEERFPSAGLTFSEVSPWAYFATQPEILLHYVKILLWPASLVFDYTWPITKSPWNIIPAITFFGVVFIGIVGLLKKYPEIAFAGIWFFLILTPTSTIIPIKDLAVEHRLYLPSWGFICFMILAIWNISYKFSFIRDQFRQTGFLIFILVATLMALTIERNKIYTSELLLWSDVVKKRPENARAHNNLGRCLIEDPSRFQDGLLHYYRALELDPQYADAHNNLGIALAAQGKLSSAIQEFQITIELDPSHALAFNNLGMALEQMGQSQSALEFLQKAIWINPNQADIYANLAATQMNLGLDREALKNCLSALKINPLHPKARNLLNELNTNDRRNPKIN